MKTDLFKTHKKRWNTEIENDYDTIVLGAGIAGMSAAISLAQNGARVLLIEQHIIPGGCCSAFQRKGFIFDSAVHNVSGGGTHAGYGRMLRKLGVEIELLDINPGDTIVLPNLEVTFPNNTLELKRVLCENFPAETKGIRAFFRELKRIYRSIWRGGQAQQLLTKNLSQLTFDQLMSCYITDPSCKQVIGGQWPYLAVAPSRLAAMEGVMTLGSYLLEGASYPKGGTQNLANAYIEAFERYGGHALLRSEAIKINQENGKICSVELSDQRTITCRSVVSTISPDQLDRLIYSQPIGYQYRNSKQPTPSAYLIYLGLTQSADLSNLPGGFYFENDYESLSNWMFVSRPTLKDPTLAPDNGQIVCTMMGNNAPFTSHKLHTEAKNRHKDVVLEKISRRSPGIEKHLKIVVTASPSTIKRYTKNLNGSAYGWASTLSQSGESRGSFSTKIPGLYQAGHWTQPGSGVPGVTLSGIQVSSHVLELLN